MPRMSDKQQRELLARVRVHNAHNFANVDGSPVYIKYRPEERGRAYRPPAWQVCRVGYQTNPGGHYLDNGHKTFPIDGRDDKDPQEAAAKAWAAQRYGVTEWAKTPFGSWMAKAFVEARLAELLGRVTGEGGSRLH